MQTVILVLVIVPHVQIIVAQRTYGTKGPEEDKYEWASQKNKSGSTTPKSDRVTRHYDPNYGYELYWPGGEWLLKGNPDATTTEAAPTVCGDDCHYIYRGIKHVCAKKADELRQNAKSLICEWTTCYGDPPDDYNKGYKTFPTYCKFLDDKCKKDRDKKSRSKWVFAHVGQCHKKQDDYFKPMPKKTLLDTVTRKNKYITAIYERFKKYAKVPF